MSEGLRPRMYFHRLRVLGAYELDMVFRDVSVILGPNKTGKSTLCQLLQFVWTGSTAFLDEINEVRDAVVYLDATFGDTRAVLRRAVYQPDYVGVYWNGDLNDVEQLSKQLPDMTFPQTAFNELVLNKLNIGVQKIFASPRTRVQKTFTLSQLFGFIHMDQYTPPQNMYPYGDKDTDLYIFNIMCLLLGVDTAEINRLQKAISDLEAKKKELNSAKDSVSRFLEQTMGITYRELEKQRKELEKRYASLQKQQEALEAEVRREAPRYPEHELLETLRPEVVKLELYLQELQRDLVDLEILENETLNEVARLQSVSIPTSFDALQVTVCPHCLAPVSNQLGESSGRCFLCQAPLPDSTSSLTNVFEKLVGDARDRLVDLRAERERLLQEIAQAKEELASRRKVLKTTIAVLDAKTRSLISPHMDTLKAITHELATVEARLAEIRRQTELLNQAGRLKDELAQIVRDLKLLDAKRMQLINDETYLVSLARVSKTLDLAYSSFISVGLVPQLQSVSVDEKTLFPSINDRSFRRPTTASDLPVLRGALYYGLLYASLKLESATFPRLLVIDTPKDKGIEEYRYTEMLRRFLELATENLGQCQVILTSGEVPPEFNSPSYIIRTLVDSEDGRLLRKAR